MKKFKKDIGNYVGASVGLSAGSLAIQGMNAPGAAGAGQGLAALGGMMPAMGTAIGGSAVIRSMDLLKTKRRKRRR